MKKILQKISFFALTLLMTGCSDSVTIYPDPNLELIGSHLNISIPRNYEVVKNVAIYNPTFESLTLWFDLAFNEENYLILEQSVRQSDGFLDLLSYQEALLSMDCPEYEVCFDGVWVEVNPGQYEYERYTESGRLNGWLEPYLLEYLY